MLFAAASLIVAGRWRPGAGRGPEGWRIVGAGFVALGGSGLVQTAWAVAAVHEGAASPVYQEYLRWAHAFNQSRAVAGVLLAVVLAWALGRPRIPEFRYGAATLAVVLTGMAGGLLWGWGEGPMTLGQHGPRLIALLALELIAFGAVLLLGAARGGLDPALAACLALYALMIAAAVPTLSGIILWSPAAPPWSTPYSLQLQKGGVHLGMLVVAVARLAVLEGWLRPPRFLRPFAWRSRPVVVFAPPPDEEGRSNGGG